MEIASFSITCLCRVIQTKIEMSFINSKKYEFYCRWFCGDPILASANSYKKAVNSNKSTLNSTWGIAWFQKKTVMKRKHSASFDIDNLLLFSFPCGSRRFVNMHIWSTIWWKQSEVTQSACYWIREGGVLCPCNADWPPRTKCMINRIVSPTTLSSCLLRVTVQYRQRRNSLVAFRSRHHRLTSSKFHIYRIERGKQRINYINFIS